MELSAAPSSVGTFHSPQSRMSVAEIAVFASDSEAEREDSRRRNRLSSANEGAKIEEEEGEEEKGETSFLLRGDGGGSPYDGQNGYGRNGGYGAVGDDRTPLLMEEMYNSDEIRIKNDSGGFLAKLKLKFRRKTSGRRRTRSLPSIDRALCKDKMNLLKICFLFTVVVAFTIVYAVYPEEDYFVHQLSVSSQQSHKLNVTGLSHNFPIVKLVSFGSFLSKPPSNSTRNVLFSFVNPISFETKSIAYVVPSNEEIEHYPETTRTEKLDFSGENLSARLELYITSNFYDSIPIAVGFTTLSSHINYEVIYAFVILIFVYVLIIFDLVHRTLAAMIGSLIALAVLASFNEKPSIMKVLSWIDFETLFLLFGMMVMVAIFCETGFFDWSAFMAYKMAKGRTWVLITILCTFTAVISAFLDNVTTILLLTPVTIRLCEVLDLDPKHILIAEVMFSNIGGTATAVGDPPNVIIVSNAELIKATGHRLNFTTFTMHMVVGCVFVFFVAYLFIGFMYHVRKLLKSVDPLHITELKQEIMIWKRTCTQIAIASREEALVKHLLGQKIVALEELLQMKLMDLKKDSEKRDYTVYIDELESKYRIRDKVLLAKCGVVLFVVVLIFFIHSFLPNLHLSIGWIAIFGAVWLLVLSDYSDLDSVLHRIEWATLLFFAALFVLMEALSELGLIAFIADMCVSLISPIDESAQTAVAIVVILWVSAIASSFIDNIPFTTAMVPVIIALANNETLHIDIDPLIFSLAFGACLGGNGTIIGASANVVCAGIAEAHGHRFTFGEFFKVGYPTMLATVFIAMCYLLICHVAFDWSL